VKVFQPDSRQTCLKIEQISCWKLTRPFLPEKPAALRPQHLQCQYLEAEWRIFPIKKSEPSVTKSYVDRFGVEVRLTVEERKHFKKPQKIANSNSQIYQLCLCVCLVSILTGRWYPHCFWYCLANNTRVDRNLLSSNSRVRA